jgi:hypothetical protein
MAFTFVGRVPLKTLAATPEAAKKLPTGQAIGLIDLVARSKAAEQI